jgi:23S rRNA pseudouridine1911/1915/1917 synthase
LVERLSYKEEVEGSIPSTRTRALGAVVSASRRHREGQRFKSSSAHMKFGILYEDENVLVIDKPAGINSDNFERRVHRLDKDTSGILLIAKDNKTLDFLQKQFKERRVEKHYLALVAGSIKNKEGTIEALIGRSPKERKKQKVYLTHGPGSEGKRKAITKYKVLKKSENYSLIEVLPKTGRRHQIRVHLAYISHPIVGDKMYGFKNQPLPEGLKRQFLHANYLKIKLPDGKIKEFKSGLPSDLKLCLQNLKLLTSPN